MKMPKIVSSMPSNSYATKSNRNTIEAEGMEFLQQKLVSVPPHKAIDPKKDNARVQLGKQKQLI